MKIHNIAKNPLRVIFLLLILIVAWAGGNKAATAETSSDGPLSVSVSLSSSAVVMGEPIILKCSVSSPAQEDVSVHVGTRDTTRDGMGADIIRAYRHDWFTLEMKDEAGRPVSAQPDFSSPQKRGVGYSDTWGLSRYNHDVLNDKYLVVNRWLAPTHPGRYVLTLHVQLPYAILTGKGSGPEVADSMTLAAGTVFRHDYQFPFTVQSPNVLELGATARALRQAVVAEKDVERQAMLIQSLFAMPEDQAGSSWQALAEDPALFVTGREGVASELAGLHSTRAADILAAMFPTAQEAADPNLTASFGSRYLEEMYRASGVPLQRYISRLYAAHGSVFPAKTVQQIIPPGYVAVGTLPAK